MLLALPYEVWRDVKDYEGLYQVSNLGRVIGLKSGKIIKPSLVNGYHRISLCKQNIVKNVLIHRLVAEAFVFNPDNKPYVDHINTNRTDNRVFNLHWVSKKENNNNPLTKKKYSEIHIGSKNKQYGNIGKFNHRSKSVLQYDLNDNFIKEWECCMDIQRELGVNHCNISNCCSGRIKSAGGYVWKYKTTQT